MKKKKNYNFYKNKYNNHYYLRFSNMNLIEILFQYFYFSIMFLKFLKNNK